MTIRILGIDPGSRVTGVALLEKEHTRYQAVMCDVIQLSGISEPLDRLTKLYTDISDLIDRFQPAACAIETPVYGKDPSAMLKLGRAQASVIMAILHKQLPVSEYYPKAVKKAITGSGNARKSQVAFMLHKMIHIAEDDLSLDATDALAVAWCHLLKMSNPALYHEEDGPKHNSRRRNTWNSFVEDNPDRIRKP